MTDENATPDADTLEQAALISQRLDAIGRIMRSAIWRHARAQPGELTPSQVLALEVLVRELREGGSGLSLSELSARMGLAHSTASGIVDRLAKRGLVKRSGRRRRQAFRLGRADRAGARLVGERAAGRAPRSARGRVVEGQRRSAGGDRGRPARASLAARRLGGRVSFVRAARAFHRPLASRSCARAVAARTAVSISPRPSIFASPVRLKGTIPQQEVAMKYMMLIYQGDTPTPPSEEWERLLR